MSSMVERSDISLLAFHVDYWDYIGWKDRFALGGNAERQRKRVSTAGGDTVYTPQVMVGEQTQVAWNSPEKFEAALLHGKSAAGLDIELHVVEKAGIRAFSVSTGESISSGTNIRVWLAYTLDGQITTVRRGENRGATLKHDGVVRHLWGPWTPPVSESMQIVNPDAEETSWNLVAFAQDADGRTLQSLTLKAGNCPVPMP